MFPNQVLSEQIKSHGRPISSILNGSSLSPQAFIY